MTTIDLKVVPRSSQARAAIRDIRSIAGMVRGLISLAEALGDIEEVQALQRQEEQRLSDLKMESQKISVDVEARKKDATREIETAEMAIRSLSQHADALHATISDREDEARKILGDARREADDIIARAQHEARSAVNAEIDRIKAKL